MKKHIILLAIIMLAASFAPLAAQKKQQTNLSGHHGEMDFVINWKQIYSYDECVKILFDLQKKYPDLCSIRSIGKSRMGREQYLMTLTAKNTGKDTDKPAMWMDGVIHGNELNAVTCCLYTAWYLLTRYDYDPKIHDILNRSTIYSLVIFNVDAYDSYVTLPNTDSNPREPFRPTDDDGDGLYDEDMAEDVDGDGEISLMYAEDPSGQYRLSKDGNRFIRIEEGDWWEGKRFTFVGAEGYDNDGDGQTGEDDLGGVDPNRNFLYDSNKAAAKTYPLSEPETRNVWMFQKEHRNILVTFNYHNTGRWIMFTAPPKSPAPPSRIGYPSQGPAGGQFAAKDKFAFSTKHVVDPWYQHDLDVVTAMVSDGLYILKDYTAPEETWLNGEHPASIYHMLGAYAFLIELWGRPTPYADTNGDGAVSDEEFAKWIELDLGGDGWIKPKEYNHPQLGKVWIGGSHKRHIDRNPPARYIEEEAMKNCFFVIHCLEEFPKPKFGHYSVTPRGGNLYQVDVEIVNDNMFPTISDRALQIGRYTCDRLEAKVSSGEILEPVTKEKVAAGGSSSGGMGSGMGGRFSYNFGKETVKAGKEIEFRTKARSVQTFTYTILSANPSATLELSFTSLTGGKEQFKINLSGKP
ncbi:MAG: hypothetical protein LBQ73_05605 [Tannerellaceae bacterium]|jgi:hypothetical protein|nr:hypothetical protein [Tannerellaceae bacterium]